MKDKAQPKLRTTTPADNSTSVVLTPEIKLTFDETVVAGKGDIVISDGKQDVRVIPMTDTQVSVSGKTVSVHLSDALHSNSTYNVKLAKGVVVDVAGNAYAGISSAKTFNFSTLDKQAPELLKSSPGDKASKIASNANIRFTFNEKIQLGTGNIILTSDNDTRVIAVTDKQVKIIGNILTLNPLVDLNTGSTYLVHLDAGAVKDYSPVNNNSKMIEVSFTTKNTGDKQAPILQHHSGEGSVTNSVTLTFQEKIQVGRGSFTLVNTADSHDKIVIPVTDAAQVTITGNVLSIHPTQPLKSETTYALTAPKGIVMDLAKNAFAGLKANVLFSIDNTAPTLTLSSDKTTTTNTAILYTFTSNEVIDDFTVEDVIVMGGTKGAFNIIDGTHYTLSVSPNPDSTTPITVSVAAGAFTDAAGNQNVTPITTTQAVDTVSPTVTITDDKADVVSSAILYTFTLSEPSSDFTVEDITVTGGTTGEFTAIDSTHYTLSVTPDPNSTTPVTVNIAVGAFTDAAGNRNVVITQNSQGVDTVAPKLVESTPLNGAIEVQQAGPLVLTFDENIVVGKGNIVISNGTDSRSFAMTDKQVIVEGKTVTIQPVTELQSGKNYQITIDKGALKDIAGNHYAGISDQAALHFKTADFILTGKAIDGYLKGSTVFADANKNGVLDVGEVSTTTQAGGQFTLENATGPLVVFGGIDESTGNAFKSILKAPEGATVVTPLTTLQQGFVEKGLSVDQAQAAVAKALGLDTTTVDLKTYDPIAQLTSATVNPTQTIDLMASSAKIAQLLVTASVKFQEVSGGQVSLVQAGEALLAALVNTIASDKDGVIDLSDKTFLKSVLDDSAATVVNSLAEMGGGTANFKLSMESATEALSSSVKEKVDAISTVVKSGGNSGDIVSKIEKAVAPVEPIKTDNASSPANIAGNESTPVSDTTPPMVQTMNAHSNGGVAGHGTIELVYDSELDGSALPDVSAFHIETGGIANPVLTMALKTGEPNVLILTMTNGFGAGAVSIKYSDPTSGNDARTIQDLAGNDADGFMSGIIADGYIRGAQVYIDTNANGIADPTEKLTGVVTDANGNFFLPSKAPQGTIIAVGGINIDTGLPNLMPMKAPAGSTTINPLTTLVQAAMDQATQSGTTLNASDAASKVAQSLGLSLPTGVSLTNFDPLSAPSNDGVALAAQKAAAQVATIVSLAATSGSGATSTILSNLVKEVSTGSLNLADASTVSSVLSGVSTSTEALTQILDANATIAAASSTQVISATQSKFIDSIAPDAPTTLVVANPTNSASPQVRVNLNTKTTDGQAVVENDQLVIAIDGVEVGTVPVNKTDLAAGYKNVIIPIKLSEASHTVGVRAVDTAGNSSALTTVSFKVDITAPLAPWVNAVTGDDIITNSDVGKTISGITDLDAQQITVVLKDKVHQVGVGADGSWSYTLTGQDVDALIAMNADAKVRAFAIDKAGNSDPVNLSTYRVVSIGTDSSPTTVADTFAPTPPTLRAVATDNIINASEKSTAQLSGFAEPNATIEISLGGHSSTEKVDSSGRWSYTLTADDFTGMGEGAETISLTATDAAGNTSNATTQQITVDTVAPVSPQIAVVASDDKINANELNSLVIQGTAEANSIVALTLGGTTRTLNVNASGNWAYTPTASDIKAIGQGSETLVATATDAAGNTSAQTSRDIVIQTTTPQLTPFTLAANSDTGLPDDRVTQTTAPTVNFTAQKDTTLAISINGGTYANVGTGTGESQSISLTGLNSSGVYSVNLRATDAVGNQTVRTGSLTIDNTVPNFTQTDVTFTDMTGAALKTTLSAGESFLVTLKFSERMLVNGTPTLGLSAGSTPINADYVRGSLSNALVFKATVGSGNLTSAELQLSPAGFNQIRAVEPADNPNVTDVAGNALHEWIETKVNTIGLTDIQLSAPTSPVSGGVPTGYLHTGDSLIATVKFTGPVTVTGKPQLALDMGGHPVNATYVSGSGTSNLTFAYVIQADQTDLDGVSIRANALLTPAGVTIKDANGYGATLTHASVDANMAYRVDSLPPSVEISSSVKALKFGETATITFTLSEEATDFTIDDVSISGGVLSNFSGSGKNYSATLTPTANSNAPVQIGVNASTFHDAAGNASLAKLGALELPVDTQLPSVQVSVLKTGELTANLVFNLSEASNNFNLNSLALTGGTVSSLSGSGTTYTGIFTAASADSAKTASIGVEADKFNDIAGNGNSSLSHPFDLSSMQVIAFSLPAPQLSLGSGIALNGHYEGATAQEATQASGVVTVLAEVGTSTQVIFRHGDHVITKTIIGKGMGPVDTTASANSSEDPKASYRVPVVLTAEELATLGNGTILVTAQSQKSANGSFEYSPIYEIPGGFTLDTQAPTTQVLSANFAFGTAVVNQQTLTAIGDTGWHTDDLITIHNEEGLYLIQGKLSAPLVRSKNADGTDKFITNPDGTNTPLYEETVKVWIPGSAGGWFEGAPMGEDGYQVVLKNNPLRKIIDNSTWTPMTMKIVVEDSAGNVTQSFNQSYQAENVRPVIEVFSNRGSFNSPAANQVNFEDTAELTIILNEPDHDDTSGPGLTLFDLSVVKQSIFNRDYLKDFQEVTGQGYTPHTVYKVTYVYTSTSTETPKIQIADGAFTDKAGNPNFGGTFNVLDSVTPLINLSANVPANQVLKAGQSTHVLFDLTDVTSDFDDSKIQVSGGTLSHFTKEPADSTKGWVYGRIYSADFTPTSDSVTPASIYVADGAFHDIAGNANADGSNDNNKLSWSVDTQIPKLVNVSVVSSTGKAINNQTNSPVVLNSGKQLTLSLTLDQDVIVTGVPQLALSIGNVEDTTPASVFADYVSGSGTRVLTFRYTIPSGVTWNDTDGISVPANPLHLPTGASIKDATSGADVNPALVAPQAPFDHYMIDTQAPVVSMALGSGVADGATAAEAAQTSGVITLNDENGAVMLVTFSQGTQSVVRTFTGEGTTKPIVLTSDELANFTDGIVNVTLKATDVAGNETIKTQSWTLDRVAPVGATFTIAGNSSAPVMLNAAQVSAAIPISINTPETGSSIVQVLLDSTELIGSNGNYSFDANTLPQGTHKVTVVTSDLAGNRTTVEKSLLIDTVAPVIPVYSANVVVIEGSGANKVLFNVNAIDANPVSYQLNTQLGDYNLFTMSASGEVTLIDNPLRSSKSKYNLTILATDAFGNSTSMDYTVRVIPQPGVLQPVSLLNDTGTLSYDGVTNDGTVRVKMPPASTPVLYWQYSTNGGVNWTTGTGETFKLLEGTYPEQSIKVKLFNLSGQLIDTSGTIINSTLTGNALLQALPTLDTQIEVDVSGIALSTAQLVRDTGSSATDGITNDGTVNVTTDNEAALWQYSVDGGNVWIDGTATKQFVLPDGSYAAGTVLVRASDLAGNTSVSKMASALSVDGHGPVLQSAYVSADGNKIVMTYNEDLASSAANTPLNAFSVNEGTTTIRSIGVLSLTVTGNTVELTLTSPVTYAQVVSLAYQDPTSNDDANAIQDAFGNDSATTATPLSVANYVSSPSALPLGLQTLTSGQQLDPSSNIVLSPGQPVTGKAGKYIFITDVGGTHYRGENAVHSFQIEASDTSKVSIIEAGAETRIVINPDLLFDLDLSSTYTVSVQPGAFISKPDTTGVTVESVGLAPVKFSTITPGLTTANAMQSYRFDEKSGGLVSASKWVDIEANGQGTANRAGVANAVVLDATGADYTFVMKDASSAGANSQASVSGIWAATDFSVLLRGVDANDRLYIDEQTLNSAQRNDASLDAFTLGQASTLKWTIPTSKGAAELFVQPAQPNTGAAVSVASPTLDALNTALGLNNGNSWIVGDGASGGGSASLTSPVDSHSVQYFVSGTQGRTALDLNLFAGYSAMQTQKTVLRGSDGLDAVFVHPGMSVDATHNGAGQDKIYLEGAWADYASSIQFNAATNVMTLSRLLNGRTESVQFRAGQDQLIFADGVIEAMDIYQKVNTPRPDRVIKADVMALVPDGSRENSWVALSHFDPTTSVRAVAGGASGASFVGLGGGAGELQVVGSEGVDRVFVRDGSHIDATQLLGGHDMVYFNGNWADYTKTVDTAAGTIRFTRPVTVNGVAQTESVLVSTGASTANQDQLIFADGSVLTNQASAALTSDTSIGLASITGVDLVTKTTLPPATPVSTLSSGVSVLDGATAAEANPASGGVLSVTSAINTQVQLVFANGLKTITKTVVVTDSTPVPVKLSASEQATLGDGLIEVRAQAVDASDKISNLSTTRFTLDTHSPSVSISVDSATGLVINHSTTVRFTLTEPSTTFSLDDVSVSGGAGAWGTLTGSGADYYATFTPNTTNATIFTINSASFQDAAGNANNDAADANNTWSSAAANGISLPTSGVSPTVPSGVDRYGLVVTPHFSAAQATANFYQQVGPTVSVPSSMYLKLGASNATQVATALTLSGEGGSLVAMAQYGQGRVAVVGQGSLIYQSLGNDPSSGGTARSMFNLMSWLSGKERTPDQADMLYVLSAAGSVSPNSKQSMFWEGLNANVGYTEEPGSVSALGNMTYAPDHIDGQISSQAFSLFPAAAGLAEALTPGGGWTRDYDVVVLPADANASVVELVRQWLHETGKGLMVDGSSKLSAPVQAFLTELGVTQQAAYHSTQSVTPPTASASDNVAHIVNDQHYIATEQDWYFSPQNMILSDDVAAKAKTISIKLTGGGKDLVLLNQPIIKNDDLTPGSISSTSSATDLASKLQTRLQAMPNGSGITVAYDSANHALSFNDPLGRHLEFLTLGQLDTSRTPNIVSTGGVSGSPWIPTVQNDGQEATSTSAAVPTTERVQFTGSVKGTYSINIHLKSEKGADLIINDLSHGSVGLDENLSTFVNVVNAAVKARAPELSVSVVKVDDGEDSSSTLTPKSHKYHDELLFTDALGRDFTRIEMMSTATYEPLISLTGDVNQGMMAAGSSSAVSTTATLGHYGGNISTTDANSGDTLTYEVIDGTKFGSVQIDSKGKWTYIPSSTAGIFQGFDNFTVQVTDSSRAKSAPAQVIISSQAAPQVAIPSVKTYTIADPTYAEPAEKSTAIPGDFHWEDVFIAQTHVYRPTDPYLTLNADRYALIKVNATSASGAAAPNFVATVTSKTGQVLGTLRLTGPDLLPKSLDLPDATNLGTQTNENSYVAPLPAAWIQPGITVKITAGLGDNAQTLSTFTPNVGADSQLVMRDANLSLWDQTSYNYMSGLGTWAQEALAKLPTQSFKLYEYPSIKLDGFALNFANEWAIYTGNQGVQSLGSDALQGAGGFNGDIKWAIEFAGSSISGANANTNYAFSYAAEPLAGGGLGGGSVGSGPASPGIFWHEVIGHGMGRPHVNADGSFPLKGNFVEGFLRGAWIGPEWGYDQVTGTYLPNYYVDENGTPTGLKVDPMQGGNTMPGYLFSIFSDYYTSKQYDFITAKNQWISDPTYNAVDGNTGGDGYFKVWGTNSIKLALTGTATVGQTLTVALSDDNLTNSTVNSSVAKTYTYTWYADGVQITGATGSTFTLTSEQAGKVISAEVNYTNSMGYAQRVTSNSTNGVALPSNSASNNGVLVVSGPQGGLVRAVLTDADGFSPTGVSYKWYRGASTTGSTESGVAGDVLYLQTTDAGQSLKVDATYTDSAGNIQTVTSAAKTIGNLATILPNGADTKGVVTMTIDSAVPSTTTTAVGKTLVALVSDADQLAQDQVSFKWYSGGSLVADATRSTFTLRQEDLGKTIKVQASYTDLKGNSEVVVSSASPQVVMSGTWLLNIPSATNYSVPYKADQQVYWMLFSVADTNGNAVTPGGTVYPGSSITPVQTTGDLMAPFHDIITGQGRSDVTGNYVLRVTYATPTGLLTEHLLMPSVGGAVNIANKGELVRADLVEAPGATDTEHKNAYAANKIVTSYINPEALANTVFRGDSGFAVGTDNKIVLPKYWNGANIIWSSTDTTMVTSISSGTLDSTQIKAGSALKAQWWDGGVMHEQVFVLKTSGNLNTPLSTSPTFTPLETQADKQLSQVWNIKASTSDLTVVSGSDFDQTLVIPTELAASGVKYWVKLELLNANGETTLVDPQEDWTITPSTQGTDKVLRVHGNIGKLPNVQVRSIKVYADDNVFDSQAPSEIIFDVNRGAMSTLLGSALSSYRQVDGTLSNDTLTAATGNDVASALRGDAGNDTITGGSAGDMLDGGEGNDSLSGGGGDDQFLISAGTDVIHDDTGSGNALVLMVSNLNNLRVQSSDDGVRLISPDDDIDLMVSSASANNYVLNGQYHGKATSTTADGIQSILVSNGKSYAALKVGLTSGDLLSATGFEIANIERVVLYGGAGDDLGILGVVKPTEYHGGSGQDVVRLDWAGMMPTLPTTYTLVFKQDPVTLDAQLSAQDSDGNLVPLLKLQHGDGNDYQLQMYSSGGRVITHRIMDVEGLRINGIDGFGLSLDKTGVVGMVGSTTSDSMNLSSLTSMDIDGGAGNNQVKIDWGDQAPVGAASNLLAGFAPNATPAVIKTNLRTSDIIPNDLSFNLGGASISTKSVGKAVLVDRSVDGELKFWVAGIDGSNIKAVQLKFTDQADGLGIQAVQAKYTPLAGNDLNTFDFNNFGNPADGIATSATSWGYGVNSIRTTPPFTLLEQDATGWAVSVDGEVVTHLRQISPGANDYELMLVNESSSPVTDVLHKVSSVEVGGSAGYRFSVDTTGVTAVRGSSWGDTMVMTTQDSMSFDGAGGRDILQLKWADFSLPSLAAGSLTISVSSSGWTLTAGGVNLLQVTSDPSGNYTLTLYKADNSTSVHTVKNIDYLALPQLASLMPSLQSSPLLMADGSLKLKDHIFVSTFDTVYGVDSNVTTSLSGDSQTILTRDTNMILRGTADEGAQVAVYDGDALLGIASRDGLSWTFTTPHLYQKPYQFNVKVTDDAGNPTVVNRHVVVTVNNPLDAPSHELLTHLSGSPSTALNPSTTAAVETMPQGVSSDKRYVVFGTNNAASFKNGTSAITDTRSDHGAISDLMVWDSTTDTFGLVTHKLNDVNSTQLHTTNYVGITSNNKYLIWTTPNQNDIGGLTGSNNAPGIFVYTLPSGADTTKGRVAGESRLINHGFASSGSTTAISSIAGYVDGSLALGNDGNTVYFMAKDASKLGNTTAFTDANPTVNDLFSYNIETGMLTLISSSGEPVTWGGQNGVTGEFTYVTKEKAYNFVENGTTATATGKDLYRLDSSGNATLLSHALQSATTELHGVYIDNTLIASADNRYVAFTYNVRDNANASGGFDFGIGGNVLMLEDTQTRTISVVNHSGGNLNKTGYQTWGGGRSVGFGDDGHSVVFTNSFISWFYSGFSTSGDYDNAVLVYDINTGTQRMLSHSPDPSNMVQGANVNYVGMSQDGKWALFSTPDASKFGNNGKAFIDDFTTVDDLIAARVSTGELRLLTGIDGVSQGGGFSFKGFSDDSNTVYLGLGQAGGYKTTQGTLQLPGFITDASGTGDDLVSVRLNLLDLNGNINNVISTTQLNSLQNELFAFLTPGQTAQLFDGDSLIATATADSTGKALWNLQDGSPGDHRYWLYDPAEGEQILLNGSLAASELIVRIVAL